MKKRILRSPLVMVTVKNKGYIEGLRIQGPITIPVQCSYIEYTKLKAAGYAIELAEDPFMLLNTDENGKVTEVKEDRSPLVWADEFAFIKPANEVVEADASAIDGDDDTWEHGEKMPAECESVQTEEEQENWKEMNKEWLDKKECEVVQLDTSEADVDKKLLYVEVGEAETAEEVVSELKAEVDTEEEVEESVVDTIASKYNKEELEEGSLADLRKLAKKEKVSGGGSKVDITNRLLEIPEV